MKKTLLKTLIASSILFSCNNNVKVDSNNIQQDSITENSKNTLVYDSLDSFIEGNIMTVIKDSKVGKNYSYERKLIDTSYSSDSIKNLYTHVYLGDIKTASGGYLKFVKTTYEWSTIPNGTNHSRGLIDIYNQDNSKIGTYGLQSSTDLPEGIENNKLVFNYKNEACDQRTLISFSDSIPKHLIVKCTKEGGINEFVFNPTK